MAPRCETCDHSKHWHEANWKGLGFKCPCCAGGTYKAKRLKRGARRVRSRSRSPHATLMRQADDLWRLIIRARTTHCECCGRPDPGGKQPRGFAFQGAHIIRRTRHQTRWELNNGFKLCQGCHTRFTFNDEAWAHWVTEKIGAEAYDALKLRSETRAQKVDLQLVIVGLTDEARQRGLL